MVEYKILSIKLRKNVLMEKGAEIWPKDSHQKSRNW
jgi:hypothetical protein